MHLKTIKSAHAATIIAAQKIMDEASARNACALNGLCGAIGRSNGELKAALAKTDRPNQQDRTPG